MHQSCKKSYRKSNDNKKNLKIEQFCHHRFIILSQFKHEKLEMRWTNGENFFIEAIMPTDANFHAGTSFAWVIRYGHICECTWALIKTSPNMKFEFFEPLKNLYKLHLWAVIVITLFIWCERFLWVIACPAHWNYKWKWGIRIFGDFLWSLGWDEAHFWGSMVWKFQFCRILLNKFFLI